MSVYVSAYIWEHSRQKGAELLLLLAIADMANREGKAWPVVPTLSRYIRMSDRTTQRIIRKLVRSKELVILTNGGPKGANLYQVQMNETLPLFEGPERGDNLSPPLEHPVDKSGKRTAGGDIQGHQVVTSRVQSGDIAMSAEPSRTNYRTAAATRARARDPVDKSRPAAAAADGKLLYPPNLSSAQQHSMEAYLKTLSPRAAQLLLDELAGLLEHGMNGKSVRDPIAVFAVLARQNDDGKFVPSHAHRVQAEREALTP